MIINETNIVFDNLLDSKTLKPITIDKPDNIKQLLEIHNKSVISGKKLKRALAM